MTSEFLMVVPPEYVEIQNATEVIRTTCGQDGMAAVIRNQAWWEVSQFMDMVGLLVPGTGVHDARMFDTGDEGEPLRLFIKWGPEI